MEEELKHYAGLRAEVYEVYAGHTDFIFDDNNPDCVAIINNASRVVIVPVGVKHLLPGCFVNQIAVEKVFLPDTVESIGGNCFRGCIALREVYCTSNLRTIEVDAFMHCGHLENVYNTDNVTTLGAANSILEDLRWDLFKHVGNNKERLLKKFKYAVLKTIKVKFPNATESLRVYYDNPKGFRIFEKRMRNAWKNPQGGYGFWNTYYYPNQKTAPFIEINVAKQVFNIDIMPVKEGNHYPAALGGPMITYDCGKLTKSASIEAFPSRLSVLKGSFKRLEIVLNKPSDVLLEVASQLTLRAAPIFSIKNTEKVVVSSNTVTLSVMEISKHHYTSYYWFSPRTVGEIELDGKNHFTKKDFISGNYYYFPSIRKCKSIISARLYLPIGPEYVCRFPSLYGRFVLIAPLELLCIQYIGSTNIANNDDDEMAQVFGEDKDKILGEESSEEEEVEETKVSTKNAKAIPCNAGFYNRFGFIVPIVRGQPEFDW